MVARHILGIECYPVAIVVKYLRLSASLEVVKVSEEGMKDFANPVVVLFKIDFSNKRITGTEMNLESLVSLLESVITYSVIEINM